MYPAASRCPPPPKAAATADRSWSPRERTLTLNRPSGCCFRTAATSDVAGRADHVDQVVGLGRAHARVAAGRPASGTSTPGRRRRRARAVPSATPTSAGTQAVVLVQRLHQRGRGRRGAHGARRRPGASPAWSPRTGTRPVSVTSPAYRQTAVSSGISPPIVSISRNTISHVDDACRIDQRDRAEARRSTGDGRSRSPPPPGSTPRPERPSRSNDAQSHVTITAGAFGNVVDLHQPVGAREQRGPPWRLERLVRVRADGRDPARSAGRRARPEHRARARRRRGSRGTRARPRSRRPSTSAARAAHHRLVIAIVAPPAMQTGDQLGRSAAPARTSCPPRTRSSGQVLQADLPPDHPPQVRRRRAQRRPRAAPSPSRRRSPCSTTHARRRSAETFTPVDGHEPDARVLQLRDLLGQDLAELLADALACALPGAWHQRTGVIGPSAGCAAVSSASMHLDRAPRSTNRSTSLHDLARW